MEFIIRKERKEEFNIVESVIRKAFWNVYMPGAEEHLLAHKLRNDVNYLGDLSRVVVYQNEIVGVIICAKATLVDSNNILHEVLTFGPLGILPEYQKMGFGAILVNEVIKLAKEAGYQAIVITGVPEYYPRFGFKPCYDINLYIDDVVQFPALMGLELQKDFFKNIGKSSFKEPDVYLVRASQKELDDFDQSFPALIKEIKPGQWKEPNK